VGVDDLKADFVKPGGIEDQRTPVEFFAFALLVAEEVQDPVRIPPAVQCAVVLFQMLP